MASNVTVTLVSPSDWDECFQTVKRKAQIGRSNNLINPDLTEEPQALIKPKKPVPRDACNAPAPAPTPASARAPDSFSGEARQTELAPRLEESLKSDNFRFNIPLAGCQEIRLDEFLKMNQLKDTVRQADQDLRLQGAGSEARGICPTCLDLLFRIR